MNYKFYEIMSRITGRLAYRPIIFALYIMYFPCMSVPASFLRYVISVKVASWLKEPENNDFHVF
ncbi:hypothetical protein DU80_02825 [Methanosarcina mazei]|jgi:hypothetical protein|uniref:Uncharacterized protein n=3 Tax=Methanosarcina TaxID=2207 RepID=A0A0F8HP70_METMZ|nr:hypothetical protein [Methanosarcina mazei]AGF97297.1 hypothetical protein MmTuc01_1964 [Methanosarcina mazei Tuc01]KKF99381.1 hypothetical protein DU40_02885 [Methanosarcina mazei]KKG02622.1 hypothetical protein DU31_09895 [Methanosarcina mazei]KKG04359.1 hypothetical protein DU47_15400 [Methanosarcina mazei]KKG13315.1 hypothetical protein DU34_00340 [Methanosarcina mazei]